MIASKFNSLHCRVCYCRIARRVIETQSSTESKYRDQILTREYFLTVATMSTALYRTLVRDLPKRVLSTHSLGSNGMPMKIQSSFTRWL